MSQDTNTTPGHTCQQNPAVTTVQKSHPLTLSKNDFYWLLLICCNICTTLLVRRNISTSVPTITILPLSSQFLEIGVLVTNHNILYCFSTVKLLITMTHVWVSIIAGNSVYSIDIAMRKLCATVVTLCPNFGTKDGLSFKHIMAPFTNISR